MYASGSFCVLQHLAIRMWAEVNQVKCLRDFIVIISARKETLRKPLHQLTTDSFIYFLFTILRVHRISTVLLVHRSSTVGTGPLSLGSSSINFTAFFTFLEKWNISIQFRKVKLTTPLLVLTVCLCIELSEFVVFNVAPFRRRFSVMVMGVLSCRFIPSFIWLMF